MKMTNSDLDIDREPRWVEMTNFDSDGDQEPRWGALIAMFVLSCIAIGVSVAL